MINQFNVGVGAPYSISKAALNAMVAKYNVAYKKQGILFMSVSPGFVDTSEGKQSMFFPSSPSTPFSSVLTLRLVSEEDLALVTPMIQSFAAYKPGFTGPITPKESVEHVLKLVHRATIEEYGGAFVSHWGNKMWL